MNIWRLATRGLWFHRRTHAAVILGVAVAAAILCGALAVGDSVRFSLRQMANARLGQIELALAPHDRLFRAKLAGEIGQELKAAAAPVLLLRGTATTDNSERRANRVQVCGVDNEFWKLGDLAGVAPSGLVLNEQLARQLAVKIGDEIVLRVEKPALLGRDAPLSKDQDSLAALRLPIARILPDSTIGRFSLQANQVPPYNAFVPLEVLQNAVEQPKRANQILVGGRALLDVKSAETALAKRFQLTDSGAYWRAIPGQNTLELRSARVFLDPALASAAMKQAEARPVLTYFANAIQIGTRRVPYSMVAGVQGAPLPSGMAPDEIVLNAWAAQDLRAKIGDSVALRYFVMGPGRRLEEKTAKFRLRAIVPISGAARDPNLMPDFPGMAEAENCRDWESGMDVDFTKIRPQDEKYWDAHRGTPKAFLSIETARKLFKNRFGDLTAVRYPLAANRANLEATILQSASPSQLGLSFVSVRAQAQAAGTQGMDFGGLFLALSFFLIVSALLLVALLFALGVENRGREIGTLLAIGFTPQRVRRLLLCEGALLAALGMLPGALLGLLYTQIVLRGLNSIWQGAVGAAQLQFHVEPSSLVGGMAGGAIMALGAIFLVVRKQVKTPARVLLSGAPAAPETVFSANGAKSVRGSGRLFMVALAMFAAAVLLLLRSATLPANQQPSLFFGAAALLLGALLLSCSVALQESPKSGAMSLLSLAGRGLRRRRGRSLAVVALLACASFLIAAIGVFRHDPLSDDTLRRRDSGTGGFAFWAESAVPLYQDLNDAKGREKLGLESVTASFVPLRVREGDDASCLNLNRAQTPTLWGVNPAQLQTRGAFSIIKGQNWSALSAVKSDAIAAIGDENTVMWGLGKGIGDTLDYVDESGQPFRVRIVGLVNKTILQGGLIIAEDNFVRLFPSASGYRAFLVDVPASKNAVRAGEEMTLALQDFGLEVVPAARRLALFQAVENTYLAVFQALGALGLLLGSIGLGVVVLRNVLERRGELAVLTAVGFRAATLRRLIFVEHALLAALGLGFGAVSGALAALPSLHSQNAPFGTLLLTFGGIALSALLWTALAASLALRGATLETLRNE